jgi:hypothetical protein
VVAGREPILVTKCAWHDGMNPRFWSEPPILRTCHQVRNEALPLFYEGNTFRSNRWEVGSEPRAIHKHLGKMDHIKLLVLDDLVFDIDLSSGHADYGLQFFWAFEGAPP